MGQGRDPMTEAGPGVGGRHLEVPLSMPKGAGEAGGALVAWWIFGVADDTCVQAAMASGSPGIAPSLQ